MTEAKNNRLFIGEITLKSGLIYRVNAGCSGYLYLVNLDLMN